MLLIEKVVKLLDDFHFDIFREYVKNISVRSYYPLALIDVIDRDVDIVQDSEQLYKMVYGETPTGEKEMKKFFQLAHHTFKLTSYLAKNYPEYLEPNIILVQHQINTGQLGRATKLAKMLQDVAEKVEAIDAEIKILNILSQRELLLESSKQALVYYERIGELLKYKQELNDINYFVYQKLKDKDKDSDENSVNQMLAFLKPFQQSGSFVVRNMSRLNACFTLYLYRDNRFYQKEVLEELKAIEEELLKNEYITIPYLYNLWQKLTFLKLNYSIKELSQQEILLAASELIKESKNDLFWNSFVNLPEINSIAIQCSYYVSNHFTSYRDDHLQNLSEEVHQQLSFLRQRSEIILKNKMLEEKFILRYINLTTIYAGLLLLGDRKDIEEGIQTLENLLIFYQQVSFYAYLDAIYSVMIMGAFCLKAYDRVEKFYRRYKKSIKDKVVNQENDLSLHGFYYLSKWLETSRKQYLNKLSSILKETQNNTILYSTRNLLIEIIQYYKIPVPVELLNNN
ncbi:MAG: hypothetical protein DHS20C18_31170 [Saprospiraceae bacterium]|nr:MAG: hypothetical protein DHS20C18_31170 [Saprospiraceae bacterium]